MRLISEMQEEEDPELAAAIKASLEMLKLDQEKEGDAGMRMGPVKKQESIHEENIKEEESKRSH